jgi:hypothetical protein
LTTVVTTIVATRAPGATPAIETPTEGTQELKAKRNLSFSTLSNIEKFF